MTHDREIRTAQEVVAERLRNRILKGELKPGERLLQAEIARDMRTSTTPVREALWQLAGAGLLDVDPHHGVVVHIPTREELTDIYDLRMLLEPVAVASAIESITEEDLERAEHFTRLMVGATDIREVVIHNGAFHETLIRASRRPRLIEILLRLTNLAMMYVMTNLYRIPGRVTTSVDEHHEIIAAYRRHDCETAQRLTLEHLRSSLTLSYQAFDEFHASSRPGR